MAVITVAYLSWDLTCQDRQNLKFKPSVSRPRQYKAIYCCWPALLPLGDFVSYWNCKWKRGDSQRNKINSLNSNDLFL